MAYAFRVDQLPLRHANDQVLNVFADTRPARSSTHRQVARDKPSVPPQDGVRQSSSRHLAERLAVRSMADFAEHRSLAERLVEL
jgi:hypothetical protein